MKEENLPVRGMFSHSERLMVVASDFTILRIILTSDVVKSIITFTSKFYFRYQQEVGSKSRFTSWRHCRNALLRCNQTETLSIKGRIPSSHRLTLHLTNLIWLLQQRQKTFRGSRRSPDTALISSTSRHWQKDLAFKERSFKAVVKVTLVVARRRGE